MKCCEKAAASPLSSSCDSAKEESTSSKASSSRSNDDSSSTLSTDTLPSSKLPVLRHTNANTPPPPSHGPARYFQGLAAGEDLVELIRGLRHSISSYCKEYVGKGEDSSSAAVKAAEAETDAAALPVPAPARSHHVSAGTLSTSQRRELLSATRTALLFSAESPSAAEEATVLHHVVTKSQLFPYLHCSTRNTDSSFSSTVATALPLGGVLRGRDMKMILSDVRLVELAREEVKHDPREGWKEALRLLHQVSPTPLTCSVELKMYRHTNGHHWAEALRCLWNLLPTQWTEMDVGSALCSLYHAGRSLKVKNAHTAQSAASFSPSSSYSTASWSPFKCEPLKKDSRGPYNRRYTKGEEPPEVLLARFIAHARQIHRTVEEAGTFQWSTPSAFNDTLGLLAQDPNAWKEASLLLEKLIAAQTGKPAVRNPPIPEARASSSENKPVEQQISSQGSTTARSGLEVYQLMRLNAVTIHQTCRAFQQRWDIGLRYLRLLQDTSSDPIDLFSDITATEDVLRLCIAGQCWQEALQLVVSHEAALRERRTLLSSHNSSPSTSSRSRAVAVELLSARQHYHPDVFVQLVRLLGAVPAGRSAAYALVQRHDTKARFPRASASQKAELSRSKHYNPDTLSRAYNCLLQGSDTLDAADAIVEELNRRYATDGHTATSFQPDTKSSSETLIDAGSTYDAKLAGLETESVAHIVYLCCVASSWERALHHTNTLLNSPRYKATFFPTARLHDAVQYALEQVQPPGPPWELSMRLFTDMMERNVPSSEVSFQSVVKRCFAGGAPEQAQKLFHLVLKRGVRS